DCQGINRDTINVQLRLLVLKLQLSTDAAIWPPPDVEAELGPPATAGPDLTSASPLCRLWLYHLRRHTALIVRSIRIVRSRRYRSAVVDRSRCRWRRHIDVDGSRFCHRLTGLRARNNSTRLTAAPSSPAGCSCAYKCYA